MKQGHNIQENHWNFPVLKEILIVLSAVALSKQYHSQKQYPKEYKALGQIKAIVSFNLSKSKESLFVMKASFS